MKKIVTRLMAIFMVMVLICLCSCSANTSVESEYGSPDSRDYTVYECDGKVWTLKNTEIQVFKEDEYFGTITGSFFRIVEDPLTFYDKNDKKIAYAGDTYHFINQDSHGIYVNKEFAYDLVGQFEIFGDTYKIYDFDENLVGTATFSMSNLNGTITDSRGNIVAEYTSPYMHRNFTVKIFNTCEINELAVLMIFGSYYSDYHHDNS